MIDGLSISNIAWKTEFDSEVLALMFNEGFCFIDIAPTKFFPEFSFDSSSRWNNFSELLRNHNIDVWGSQSLLFGKTDWQLFDSNYTNMMFEHLRQLITECSRLGVKRFVFGSPKNRHMLGKSREECDELAIIFFQRLHEICRETSTVLCLEPNPVQYGGDYLTSFKETVDLVKQINRLTVLCQFDTGAIFMNNGHLLSEFENNEEFVGHVHLSKPNLKVIDREDLSWLRDIAKLLQRSDRHYIPAIEMLSSQPEMTDEIKLALEVVGHAFK